MPLRRFLLPAAGALVVVGAAAYLLLTGEKPGAPFVFLLAGAAVLVVTLRLLYHTARALLFEPEAEQRKVATGRRRRELLHEKTGLLKVLKELEFDHEMHKISDGDFAEISTAYRARAVRVMRQLDETGLDFRALAERDLAIRAAATATAAATTAAPAPAAANGAPVAADESAVAAGGSPVAVVAAPVAAVAAPVAVTGAPITVNARASFRAASRPASSFDDEPATRVACLGCGTANDPDAAFCKRCGARVASEVES